MLLHTESSVLAAIEDPAVREERLRSLRKERAYGRVASLLAFVGPVILALASRASEVEPHRVWSWFLVLLGTVIVTVRAESQVNLLLAVDRLEELLAKRSSGSSLDGE